MTKTHRIIVLDDLAPEGLALLGETAGVTYDVRTGLDGAALREALGEYDGAICRSGVKLTADVLEGNRALRAIVRAGVGTDNIDKDAATRAGIVVMNTPAGNTVSTAEHTLALMLALARNIAPANQSLVEGRWDRKAYMGNQLAGKVLGVVGLGRVGQAVARRAKAFEMRVLGYDPYLSRERAEQIGVELVESVEEIEGRAAALEAELAEERRVFDEFRRNVERETAEAEVRVAELHRELEKHSAQDVPPDHLDLYRRLLSTREGEALAELQGQICQGCYVAIPKNLAVRLARGVDLVQCPSCDRILYVRY